MFVRLKKSIVKHGIKAVCREVAYRAVIYCKNLYFRSRLSLFYLASKINLQKVYRGVIVKDKHFRTANLIAMNEGGYATRALIPFSLNNHRYVASANVGSDSVSIYDAEKNYEKIKEIKFKEKSAPIGIHVFGDNEKLSLAVINFNFDETLQNVEDSSLYIANDLDELLKDGGIIMDAETIFDKVYSVHGCWHLRAMQVFSNVDGSVHFFITDRDADIVHWVSKDGDEYTSKKIVLGSNDKEKLEPVGIEISRTDHMPEIYIGFRKRESIAKLIYQRETGYKVNFHSVPGQSRSSVCMLSFDGCKKALVQVMWGGDPEDIDTVHYGTVVIMDIDSMSILYEIPCGIHPTDVVVADIDGDGEEEIIVLNYGTGQSYVTRSNPGNVQVFKYIDNEFKTVCIFELPFPRIGCSIKSLSGKKENVLVNLFFEQKLVEIGLKDN